MQKGSRGAQGRVLLAVQDFLQVKGKVAALGPFRAVEQADGAHRNEKHPARSLLLSEDMAAENFFPRQIRCRRLAGFLGILPCRVGSELHRVDPKIQRVCRGIVRRTQGTENPEQWSAGCLVHMRQKGQAQSALQRAPGGLRRVTQCQKKRGHQGLLLRQALLWLAKTVKAVSEAEHS